MVNKKKVASKKFRRLLVIQVEQVYETQDDGVAICVQQNWETYPDIWTEGGCSEYYDCSTGEKIECPPRYRRNYIELSNIKQIGTSKECCTECGVNSKVAGICDGTNSAYCRDCWENHVGYCDACCEEDNNLTR